MTNTTDEDAMISELLAGSRTIAMVGASPDPSRDSNGIMRQLQRAGYRVIPVNPLHAGKTLHGETIVGSLEEAGPVDLVDVFRRPDALDEVVEDSIRSRVPAIWTQLGVRNEKAADRARSAGLKVVMDRCIGVELSRHPR